MDNKFIIFIYPIIVTIIGAYIIGLISNIKIILNARISNRNKIKFLEKIEIIQKYSDQKEDLNSYYLISILKIITTLCIALSLLSINLFIQASHNYISHILSSQSDENFIIELNSLQEYIQSFGLKLNDFYTTYIIFSLICITSCFIIIIKIINEVWTTKYLVENFDKLKNEIRHKVN